MKTINRKSKNQQNVYFVGKVHTFINICDQEVENLTNDGFRYLKRNRMFHHNVKQKSVNGVSVIINKVDPLGFVCPKLGVES